MTEAVCGAEDVEERFRLPPKFNWGALSLSQCTDECSYGPAPHVCFYKIEGATIGQSQVLPRDQWPANFEPDHNAPGLGVHHACGWSV